MSRLVVHNYFPSRPPGHGRGWRDAVRDASVLMTKRKYVVRNGKTWYPAEEEDDLSSKVQSLIRLYERPGTPGEKAAALEALRRLQPQVHLSAMAERILRSARDDASVVVLRPAREMSRAEIEAEIEAGGGRAYQFPGGAIRWKALQQVLAEKKSRGEDILDPGMSKVLLKKVNQLAFEGGGSVAMKNCPGGDEWVWDMIDAGYLDRDEDYVSLTQSGKRFAGA